MLTNTITIIDLLNYGSSSSNNYKVLVTDYNNNSAVLTGSNALEYLKQTYLNGYINSTSPGQDSGVLPPGVRIVGEDYVVFERPPSYQNVFYNINRLEEQSEDEDQEDYIKVFRIPLPWQVYIATFNKDYYVNDVYMFFSETSLMSKNQNIYLPPLPNFYTSGLLCRPMFSQLEELERYPKNLSGVIASAYDWIWNNGTNNDLNEAMVHVKHQIAKNPEEKNNTIFAKMPQDVYEKYFLKRTTSYPTYYDSTRVIALLTSWEQCTIEEVVGFKWPNFSITSHFDHSVYNPDSNAVHEYLTNHPDFYDLLHEWGEVYYEGESQEDLEYILNEGDYNHDSYYEYVRNSGHIHIDYASLLQDDKTPPQTLSVAINRLMNEDKSHNIRSIFNSSVQKAFEISENKVASSS